MNEMSMVRIEHAFDEVIKDEQLRRRLIGRLVDLFLNDIKQEMTSLMAVVNHHNPNVDLEDLIIEQVILFMQNRSLVESPEVADALQSLAPALYEQLISRVNKED